MPSEHGRSLSAARIISTVFLPFALAYFLSYLFRTVNGTISGSLMSDFHVGAGNLGLLTSIYFLSFAAAQLPLGALIDAFGPRRVQSGLVVVAALGALIFAEAHSFAALLIGRALIGLGVAGALMAGLKALVLWAPKERIALYNGCFIMFGGLGAIAATRPVELMLHVVDWRTLFVILGALTALSATVIWLLAPEKAGAAARTKLGSGIAEAFRSATFWRLAPLSAIAIATAWSAQGLWAARWFVDVDALEPGAVASRLFWMSVTLTLGAVLIGIVADRLKHRGLSSGTIFGSACGLFIVIQCAVLKLSVVPDALLWAAFAVFGGMTVLSYAMLAENFPKESIGRTNGALNLLHIGTSCVVQYGMGVVISFWTPDALGHYPVSAYRAAFGLPLLLECAALAWFVVSAQRTNQATAAAPTSGS